MYLDDKDLLILRRLIMVYKLEWNFNHDFRKSKYTDLKIKNPIPNLTQIDEKIFDSLSETEKKRIIENNQHLFDEQ